MSSTRADDKTKTTACTQTTTIAAVVGPASVSVKSDNDDDHLRSHRRRKKHHHRHRDTASSSSSSSSSSPPRRNQKKKCTKCCTAQDPLEPTFSKLSSRQKRLTRDKILNKIRNMQRNYPNEPIHLPSAEKISDLSVCYRRYKRIAKHLYAKQRISHYRFIMFFVTVIIQVGLSIFFETAASEYLQKELDDVAKYDPIFYEMGCKAFVAETKEASPQSRLIYQMGSPILVIAVMYFLTKFTPMNKQVINICLNLWSKYNETCNSTVLDGAGQSSYNTLLDDEDQDEDDHSDSDDGEEIGIPDLEANIPGASNVPPIVKEMIPDVIKMFTSARALPEGTKPVTPGELASNLFNKAMFGKPSDKNTTPVKPSSKEPSPPAPPVIYDD